MRMLSAILIFAVFCSCGCMTRRKALRQGAMGVLLVYEMRNGLIGNRKVPKDARLKSAGTRGFWENRMVELTAYRLKTAGVENAIVTLQGNNLLAVRLPYRKKPVARAKPLLERGGAYMEWCLINDDPEKIDRARRGELPYMWRLVEFDGKGLLLEYPTLKSSDFVRAVVLKNLEKKYIGAFEMTDAGDKLFFDLMKKNPYRYVAVLLNGEVAEVLRLVPANKGSFVLEGYSWRELLRIVDTINRGCLPFATELKQAKTFGADSN